MAQLTSDVLALQLEAVRDTLPILYEYNDFFFSLIETRKDLMKVSSRAARIPIQDQPGSRFGSVNLAGGVLGRGTATHYDVPTITALSSRIAVEIDEDVLKQTDGEPQAIRKILSLEIFNAMKEFRRQMNATLQTDGTGTLATITAATTGAGGSVTVKTSPFYAQLLRTGQIVTVYDSTLATNRGAFTIATIDEVNAVVTATSGSTVPAATVATDVLVPEGLSGANPVWYFGIPYLLSDASSGTWLTLSRSTVPQIRDSAFDAASNNLTTYPIRLVLTKILQRVGMVNPGALRAHMHPTQVDAYEELAILISSVQKGASAGESVDPFFSQKQMAGVDIASDIHAARDRIDFLNLENWGKIESSPVDFLKRPDGTYFERPVDSTTGSPLASVLFYIIWFGNFFTDNPASQGHIHGLAISAGYDAL